MPNLAVLSGEMIIPEGCSFFGDPSNSRLKSELTLFFSRCLGPVVESVWSSLTADGPMNGGVVGKNGEYRTSVLQVFHIIRDSHNFVEFNSILLKFELISVSFECNYFNLPQKI